MKRRKVFNEKDERMFDIVEDPDGVPKLEIKTGKGNNAYRYMDARDAMEEISKVIEIEG